MFSRDKIHDAHYKFRVMQLLGSPGEHREQQLAERPGPIRGLNTISPPKTLRHQVYGSTLLYIQRFLHF